MELMLPLSPQSMFTERYPRCTVAGMHHQDQEAKDNERPVVSTVLHCSFAHPLIHL